LSDLTAPTTVPFYRDVKKLAVLAQVIFLVVIVGLIFILINNVNTGLQKQNLSFTFDFLTQVTSFRVDEGTAFGVPYDNSVDNYIKAIAVGLYNTLRIAVTGIFLATLLGVIVGIGRLSSNWLVSRLALVYVEILRNTPLLVQLIVWYYIIILGALPKKENATPFLGMYLSTDGFVMPWMVQKPDAINFFPVTIVAFLIGVAVFWFFSQQRKRTGTPIPAGWFGIGAWLCILIIGFFALGQPLEYGLPQRTQYGFSGGLQISPEFVALLLGLVIYTSAFIAEITRAGIQAVHKGQWEAARAIGLGYSETLQLIILPQALRVMIPPLGNQYLNLTKNSSLAVAIGYSDVLNVLSTAGNQSGANLQTMTIAGGIYLVLSLSIAFLVNMFNRATQIKTR
jgi:general L-amino acid transport system permease protein